MADINLVGVGTPDGRNRAYGVADVIVDTSGNILTITGIGGFTGLFGATGINTGGLGETGILVNGIDGFTGLAGISGPTGSQGLSGRTGIAGITGTDGAGIVGLYGATGLVGNTGLSGMTGIAGITGFTIQGVTGIIGFTGILGATGVSTTGQTGISGETGALGSTGLQGVTGISVQGLTGLQGSTGIIGATGAFGYQTLDVQQQISGFTLLYTIVANTLTSNRPQLTYQCWGRTAGATTAVRLTYGNETIIDEFISEDNTDFSIRGCITRIDVANQEVVARLQGSSYSLVENYPSTVSSTGNNSFAVSVSSSGSGHVIYALIVARN